MVKKFFFMLALFIFLMILFLTTNVLNGLDIKNLLYKDTKEVHITYFSNVNLDDLMEELVLISRETNSNISQYHFTAKDTLKVISTNSKKNKLLKLKSGKYPQNSNKEYLTNFPVKDTNVVGRINLPSNYIKINVYNFDYIKTAGLGTIFYVQGETEEVATILKKYGEIDIRYPSISETFRINMYQGMLTIYLSLFFFIGVIFLAYQQKRIIILEKAFGYNKKQVFFHASQVLLPIFYSLGIAFLCFIILNQQINKNTIYSLVLCIGVIVIFYLFYMLLIGLVYFFSNISRAIKGALPSKFMLILIAILFVGSLLTFLDKTVNLKNELDRYNYSSTSYSNWNATEDLYKTNITNQLNRNNELENSVYMKNAQFFYEMISEKYETFIIAPYNYVVWRYTAEKLPIYIGQNRSYDEIDYITNPGGKGIIIDQNYLDRNAIKFIDSKDEEKINTNLNVLTLLVPKKYQKYEPEISKKYLSDLIFRLEEDPPRQPILKENINIQIIYVENDQKYFTYNPFYGNEKENYMIEDPIVTIVNPNLMSGLFWGNILTMDGGLFFDFSIKTTEAPFEQIKKEIDLADLTNILNFILPVFKERGEEINKMRISLFNSILQYLIFIIAIIILQVQMLSIMYKIHAKKIFIKQTLGYSQIEQFIDIICLPMILQLVAITLYIIQTNAFFYSFSILMCIFIVNLIFYKLTHKKTIHLKGGLLC